MIIWRAQCGNSGLVVGERVSPAHLPSSHLFEEEEEERQLLLLYCIGRPTRMPRSIWSVSIGVFFSLHVFKPDKLTRAVAHPR